MSTDKKTNLEVLKKIAPPSEFVEDRISVIIPFYGSFNTDRFFLTLDSVMAQKNVDLEVVVSEQGEFPQLEERIGDAKYIFGQHTPSAELSDFRPGLVRDIAIRNSGGEFIYTTDADIVFLNPFYLEVAYNLLKKDSNLVLNRPPMRRLPLVQFDSFKSAARTGIQDVVSYLDFSQDYFAFMDGRKIKVKVITRQPKEGYPEAEDYAKTFTAYYEEFERYIGDPSLKGKEPIIWNENRHCGGIFMRREQFDIVGGYCRDFINWGCEDSDLQWKLLQCFNSVRFPLSREYEVLHLDHPKGYFSPEMWKRNEAIASKRRDEGVVNSAIYDYKNK